MSKILLHIFTALILISISATAQEYAKLVEPRIGSEGNGLGCGYSFIGATYPFGMVQFSPGFFTPQRGFAITQLSGAGCANMGNFPVLPLEGRLSASPNDMDGFPKYEKVNDCHAGYLSVSMDDNILAELTVNQRSGIANFTFGSDEGTVIIGAGISATSVNNARIEITSPSTCEGFSLGGDFCGSETPYQIYFAAEFDQPAKNTGTWMKTALLDSAQLAHGKNSGAYFTFDTKCDKEVTYRIAISFVSIENARKNLANSRSFADFHSYRSDAERVWNENLSKIKIDGGASDRKIQFYTHLYHCFIHPNIVSDCNGEYMGADYAVHKVQDGREYYSSFSVWDTYRTQAQLVAMLYPKQAADMMQSLVDFAVQSGGYGRWILANIETGIMQGDPTPILIANSYAFGATNFDVDKAYQYMKKGATVPLSYSQDKEIRPFLTDYIEKGLAPASMLLEYVSADFAIGKFADHALGNQEEASFFFKRAQNWKKMFNPQLNWLCSRNLNGQWKKITDDWREGTYKNYFWMVPHNLDALIDTIGGKNTAEARLDSLFVRLDASYDDDWFAAGNEPDFQVPWIYNWTDSPAKTSQVVSRILKEMYNSTPSGLPGNDDLGSMGAWYVFASIGLYPMIPGVGGFSVNYPQFEYITVTLPLGKLVINCRSCEKKDTGLLRLNNRPHRSRWIDWNDLKNGAILTF